jgi:hypothetical protein
MFLTVQRIVNGNLTGLQRQVQFRQGGTLMQSDYEPIGSGDIRRALSNKAIVVNRDEDEIKFALTITGSGWHPPGLDDLRGRRLVRLGCILPMSQQTSGGAITPIRTARTDVAPYAHAMTPKGLVSTSLEDWTPGSVSGALYYIVTFFPLLDGYAEFSGGFNQGGGRYNWTLDFQEK